MVGVERFALRAAVGEDDRVVFREVGDVLIEGAHAAVVSVDHEQGRPGAVDFGVHLEAVDVVVFAGGGIVAVGDRLGLLGDGRCDEEGGGED